MRMPYSWKLAVIGWMICLGQITCAQTVPSAVDEPQQRWLPLPPGSQANLLEQMELLQLLQNRLETANPVGDNSSKPKLNDLQKEMVEQAIEQWQKSGGNLATDATGNPILPDLSSVPKEWVDAAQSDPKLRQQAQRLLEQYARDRRLAPTDRTPEKPKPTQPFPNSDPGKPNATPNTRRENEKRPSDAESFKALKDLFNQLKAVDELRSPFGTAQDELTSNPSNRAAPSRSSSSQSSQGRTRQNQQPTGQQPAGQGQRSAQQRASQQQGTQMRSGPGRQPLPPLGQPFDPSYEPPPADNDFSDRATQGPTLPKGVPGSSPDPIESFGVPQSSNSNAIDMGSTNALDGSVLNQGPSTVPTPALPKGFEKKKAPSTTPDGSSARPSTGSGTDSDSELDMKQQLNRFGLGGTLQRMLEKRLKEHKIAANNAPSNRQPSSPIARPKNLNANSPPKRKPPEAAVRQQPPSTSTNDNDKNSLSATLRDAWKSLSQASPPQTANSGKRDLALDSGFEWRGRLFEIALLMAGLLCCGLWLFRKRIQGMVSMQPTEAELVKSILAQGIHTRNDVVRAFHCLVRQATEPVATWWTHRRAAHRLSESIPNIATAMHVLATVYEQARYSPPDVVLSDEQLRRVQSALQQCDAYQS